MSVHQFACKLANGEMVSLSKYAGKALLIVNTASQCGFTISNMQSLNTLMDSYDRPHIRDLANRGKLQVLAFPCNQFGGQEPKTACEVQLWAGSVFGSTFPVFDKVDVKGPNADPLWKHLGEKLGAPRWNFNKYLCDPDGVPVQKFSPAIQAEMMKTDIDLLLAKFK